MRNNKLATIAFSILLAVGFLALLGPAAPPTARAEGVRYDGNSNPATFGVLLSDGVTPKMLRFDSNGYLYTTTAASFEAADSNDSPVTMNPITVGGRADTTQPSAVGDGDAAYFWLSPRGSPVVSGWDGTNPQAMSVNASGHVNVRVKAEATAGTQTEVTGKVADADVVTAAAGLRLFSLEIASDIDDSAYGTVRLGDAAGGCTGAAVAYVSIGYVPAQPKNLSRHFDFGPRGVDAADGVCLDWTYGTISVSANTVVEAAP